MTEHLGDIIAFLPFEWAQYQFMRNALLAVLIVCPMFAALGTIVVNNRMAFFSDVLGHSALTGVALGVLLGIGEPFWAMLVFVVALSVIINIIKRFTETSFDTVLGVVLAFAMALGIVILSRGGGFAKYTGYLIGDILTVTGAQILTLLGLLAAVIIFWTVWGNALTLSSVSPVLARSRGSRDFLVQVVFAALLAVITAVSIRLVGILIINSLLILPAAAARNTASSMRAYTFWAVLISMISGVSGLTASFYWETASGATIVLFAVVFYAVMTLFCRRRIIRLQPSDD